MGVGVGVGVGGVAGGSTSLEQFMPQSFSKFAGMVKLN